MSTCQSLLRVRCSVFYLSSLIFFLIIPSGLKVQDFPSNTAWTTCYNQLCLQCPHVLLQQLVSRSLSQAQSTQGGKSLSHFTSLHCTENTEKRLLCCQVRGSTINLYQLNYCKQKQHKGHGDIHPWTPGCVLGWPAFARSSASPLLTRVAQVVSQCTSMYRLGQLLQAVQ